MQSFFSGPHGTEEEPHSDFWANLPEAGDALPGTLPGNTANGQTAGNSAADEELYRQAVTRRATDPRNAAEGRGSLDEAEAGETGETRETDEADETSEADKAENEAENEGSASETGSEGDETTAEEIADPAEQASPQDPLGSWTGVPDLNTPNVEEVPTQDQDDL